MASVFFFLMKNFNFNKSKKKNATFLMRHLYLNTFICRIDKKRRFFAKKIKN